MMEDLFRIWASKIEDGRMIRSPRFPHIILAERRLAGEYAVYLLLGVRTAVILGLLFVFNVAIAVFLCLLEKNAFGLINAGIAALMAISAFFQGRSWFKGF
jgi:hypothetical protein